MYTSPGLTDLHQRTHRCLARLLRHCAEFSEEELSRELEGFGYPSLRLQLHHVIGAEQYWIGVLEGKMLTDEVEAEYASIDALRAFRERVAGTTAAWLESVSEDELNARREVTTWGDRQVRLVPARVIVRTQTHVFQHQGQIAAMCRILGRPIPAGLDFPVK